MAKKEITTADLRVLLRERYQGREWVYVEEVPNGTGSHRSRSADAIAMGVWAKSEFALNGFEIKSSRSDWRAELNNIGKSAPFEKVCHYWWLVAPKSIVQIQEVPVNWGWLYPGKTKLNIGKRPVKNIGASLNYEFFAGLLRRVVSEAPGEKQIELTAQASYNKGYRDGMRSGQDAAATSNTVVNKRYESLQQNVAAFESASGLRISDSLWRSSRLGEIVQRLDKMQMSETYALDCNKLITILRRMLEAAERDALAATECLKFLKEPEEQNGTV